MTYSRNPYYSTVVVHVLKQDVVGRGAEREIVSTSMQAHSFINSEVLLCVAHRSPWRSHALASPQQQCRKRLKMEPKQGVNMAVHESVVTRIEMQTGCWKQTPIFVFEWKWSQNTVAWTTVTGMFECGCVRPMYGDVELPNEHQMKLLWNESVKPIKTMYRHLGR